MTDTITMPREVVQDALLALESKWTCYETGNINKSIQAMKAALAAPEPQPVKQADDWEIRGQLTALKCWHRLTEAEADDLVVFTAMLTGAAT